MFQADEAAGETFFAEHWPDAEAIADPDRSLYAAFGLGRGSVGQLFGPSVWKAGWRAFRKRHGAGLPVGDPLVMPGAFLVHEGAVRWVHEAKHAGDHPTESDVLSHAARLTAA